MPAHRLTSLKRFFKMKDIIPAPLLGISRLMVAAGTTLAVLTGIAGLRSLNPPHSSPGGSAAMPALALASHDTGGTATLDRSYQWKPGATQSYEFHLQLKFTPAANQPLAAQVAMDLEVSGALSLLVLTAGKSQATVAMGLSDVRVLSHGAPAVALGRLIERNPCVLDLDPDGSIKTMRWKAGLAEDDRRLVAALYRWPFVLKAGATTWTASEEDETGRYAADYRVIADGTVIKSRRSVNQLTTLGASAPEATQSVQTSRFAGLPGEVWLEKLTGEETTRVMLNGQTFGHSRLTLSLVRADSPAPLSPALAALAAKPDGANAFIRTSASTEASSFEQLQLQERAEKLRGKSFATVLQPLKEAAERAGSHADTLPALQNLVDWLKENPEGAGEVAASLKSASDDDLSALLAHSLEAADTLQSQEALAAVLEDFVNCPTPALLQSIVAASGLTELRSERIVSALRDIVVAEFTGDSEFDANDTALYAMSELAKHDADLRGELAGALVPRLAPEEDAEDIRTSLLALQNAAITQGRIAAESLAASHPDPLVRETALSYLASIR